MKEFSDDRCDSKRKSHSSTCGSGSCQLFNHKIAPELLEEGKKRDEESLWTIHETFYNNGEWERASNRTFNGEGRKEREGEDPLHRFLMANDRFIDLNVQAMVKKGEQEGIRMALNQIHYGWIEEARKCGKEEQSWTLVQRRSKKYRSGKQENHNKVVSEFIINFKHLIEPTVYEDAMFGNDKGVSLAPGQIHHKTLPIEGDKVFEKSFKEVLVSSPKKMCRHGPYGAIKRSLATLQKGGGGGVVKDIILPRKRDRFGNRIGFLVSSSHEEAQNIIANLNGRIIGSCVLYLAEAKVPSTNPRSSKPPNPSNRARPIRQKLSPEIAAMPKIDGNEGKPRGPEGPKRCDEYLGGSKDKKSSKGKKPGKASLVQPSMNLEAHGGNEGVMDHSQGSGESIGSLVKEAQYDPQEWGEKERMGTCEDATPLDTKLASDRISEVSNASEDEGGSLINPLRPKTTQNAEITVNELLGDEAFSEVPEREEVLQNQIPSPNSWDFDTRNWKPREHDSPTSILKSLSEEENSGIDDSPEDDLSVLQGLHPNILKDLKNLKVQIKRERPRKLNSK
ncbi:hypothetical protein ACET3Z_001256 [Daucus carota]